MQGGKKLISLLYIVVPVKLMMNLTCLLTDWNKLQKISKQKNLTA